MSVDQVKTLFLTDASAYLDTTASLYFIDPLKGDFHRHKGEAHQHAPATTEANTGSNQLLFSLDQTFNLQSKPNSPRTIYLDFNGHVATNTAWNSGYSLSTINSPAFDLDKNSNTFNNTELQTIQNIWKRVAEDFAPFDVNVTTIDKGSDAINRTSATDSIFGSHIVITTDFTRSTSKPCVCGGFAYMGVFDIVYKNSSSAGFYNPGYVFYNNLGSNEQNIAEAVSHEAGHHVGLNHDGTSSSSYYKGHGSGTTSWAPIMGVGYGKQIVQWSKGEYSNANNKEDDYLVMQSNSLYFDADEFANTIAEATELIPQTTNDGFVKFNLQGTLQGPNDMDLIKVKVGAGQLIVNAKPFHLSPNTDLKITLLNSTGTVLASANPDLQLNADVEFTIPEQGSYSIQVEGVGRLTPTTGGYSKYGSIGIYTLNITGQPLIIVNDNKNEQNNNPDENNEKEPAAAFAYNQLIQATSFTSESHPNNKNLVRNMGTKVGYIKNGTFIKFENLAIHPTDKIIREVEISYSSAGSGGIAEFILEVPGSAGTQYISLGKFALSKTGNWDKFVTKRFTVNLPSAAFNDITLKSVPLQIKFTNTTKNDYLFDIRSFKLSNTLSTN